MMDNYMDLLYRRTDSPDYTPIINFRIRKDLLEQISMQVGASNKDLSDVINALLEKALKND